MRTAAPIQGLKALLRPLSRPELIATVVAIGVVAGAGLLISHAAEGQRVELRFDPPGGRFKGPVMVTILGAPRDMDIYVSPAGEPTSKNWRWRGGPFRVAASDTLRARAFQKGTDAPCGQTAEASFTIETVVGPGVPFHPVDWKADVDQWWATHPMNPKSPNAFQGPIRSPEPRINVAEVRAKNPDSTTAGVEEALAMLPEEGGTLWFPKDKGPYCITKPATSVRLPSGYLWGGAIKIRSRSNIHFVSDGASIQCAHTAFGICGDEFDRYPQAERPATNFYFENLVFDGVGQAGMNSPFPQTGTNFHFLNTSDVLFEGCRFVNSKSPGSGHGGCISLAFKSDNVWCRNCYFQSGLWGVYWDGVHGGGLVNCTFGSRFQAGGFLLLTNDDLSPFDRRLRDARYVVVAGCTFGDTAPDSAGGKFRPRAFQMAGSDCLFADNTVRAPYQAAVASNGKLCPDFRPYDYHYSGNRILRNTLEAVPLLLQVDELVQKRTKNYQMGDVLVADNIAAGLERILFLHHVPGVPPIHDVVVRNNRVSGRATPQVVIDDPHGVKGIHVLGNQFRGAEVRPLVVDTQGRKLDLPPEAVKVENNDMSAEPRRRAHTCVG